jgi:hypothetical protein
MLACVRVRKEQFQTGALGAQVRWPRTLNHARLGRVLSYASTRRPPTDGKRSAIEKTPPRWAATAHSSRVMGNYLVLNKHYRQGTR